MNSLQSAPTIIFVAFVLGLSLVFGSRWGGKNPTLVDYFMMNKELRSKQLGAAFVAADMSVATVVLALGLVGYRYGFWAAAWITICWILGIFLFLRFIRTPALLKHVQYGQTLHEVIGTYYDSPGARSWVRATASMVTVIVFLLTVGLEFFAGFVVFTKLPGAPSPIICAVALAVVVIVYTVRGGFRGTTRINIFRLSLVVTGFLILAFLGYRFETLNLHAQAKAVFGFSAINIGWLVAVAITLLPAQLAAMDMWQRCSAANGDYSIIRRGLLRSMPFYLIWLAPPYIGALARVIGVHADNLNFIVLDTIRQIQPSHSDWWLFILQPLLYGGLVATIGCTTDTLLNATTFTFMSDVYPAIRNVDPADLEHSKRNELVSRAKLCTALLGLGALVVVFLGLFIATIYDIVAALFSIQILLFWPVLYIVVGHRRDLTKHSRMATLGLLLGVISAFAVLIVAIITHDRDIMDAAPIAATFVSGLAFTCLFFAAPKRGQAAKA